MAIIMTKKWPAAVNYTFKEIALLSFHYPAASASYRRATLKIYTGLLRAEDSWLAECLCVCCRCVCGCGCHLSIRVNKPNRGDLPAEW